jgi:adenylate cyclase
MTTSARRATGRLRLLHTSKPRTKPEEPSFELVSRQLDRILANSDFDASPRSRAFLRFIVEETLAGRGEGLTQGAIATRVFGRREDFDPTVDPIVRIQAGRLRRSLERYYLLSGAGDTVRIELPRGTYVPLPRWSAPSEETTGARGRDAVPPSAAIDEWPSVVVERFHAATADPELDQAAVRFQEHLAVELGRYGDLRVVLPGDSDRTPVPPLRNAHFGLSGRVSREEGALRVTARLLDGRSGRQIWADKYVAGPDALPASLEETARVVAARLASEQGVVGKHLWAERRKEPSGGRTPYDAILRSYRFFFSRKAEELAPAIEALREAVTEEPECGLAWVMLARLYCSNYAFEVAPLETPIDDAVEFAQNGVQVDPASQRAAAVLGAAFFFKDELAVGRAELQRTLDLNPASFIYLEWIGWLLTMMGDWERGPALVRRAMARNPLCNPVAHLALWAEHLHREEIEEAHQAAQRLGDGIFFWRPMMRACSLGHLGRLPEAKAAATELLKKKPDFPSRGRALIGRIVKLPDLFERVVDGLGKAGLELD